MAVNKQMTKKIKQVFAHQQEGIGVVEIILILVIIIGLVLIFREQITEILENILDVISGGAEDISTLPD